MFQTDAMVVVANLGWVIFGQKIVNMVMRFNAQKGVKAQYIANCKNCQSKNNLSYLGFFWGFCNVFNMLMIQYCAKLELGIMIAHG